MNADVNIDDVSVGLASKSDTSGIVTFISRYWNKDHIFVTSKSFFDYEMTSGGVPNFVIAKVHGQITGLVGFLKCGEVLSDSDLQLVVFRVMNEYGHLQIGVKLIRFVQDLTKKGVHTVGANPKTLRYYEYFLGFKTGWMAHYYWLNENSKNRALFLNSTVTEIKSTELIKNTEFVSGYEVKTIRAEDVNFDVFDKLNKDQSNRKSHSYFIHRYPNHPIYHYDFFALRRKPDDVAGIGVIRCVDVLGARGFRFIDWVGPESLFSVFCRGLIGVAKQQNIDFIDLYCTGLDKNGIIGSGFQEIDNSVIIPNYLEPLVMKNIEISYVTSADKNIWFFRGDGDQDRPSILQ